MEEINSNPPSNLTVKNSGKSKFLLLFLTFLLLISSALNVFLVFKANQTNPTSPSETTSTTKGSNSSSISNWSLPKSSKKGFAINLFNGQKNPSLFIYSLDEKKLKPTNISNGPNGFSYGFGIQSPISSPDFLYSAIIADKNLWIMSNETLEKTQATNNNRVEYLGGWSKDSKNIVFYVSTIFPWSEGMSQRPNDVKKIPKTDPPGFYNLNIETGKVTYLFPLKTFLGFMDNERILTTDSTSSNSENKQTLEVFNINNFEMDYRNSNNYGFGVSQYQFNNDGTKWTLTLSRNPTEDANIIFADYPNKEGETIDSAGWADVQHPLFSSDGKKIAYYKRDGNVRDGVPKYMVAVYDTQSKSKKVYAEGQIESWVGPDELIYRENGGDSSKDSKHYLLNTSDSSITPIN